MGERLTRNELEEYISKINENNLKDYSMKLSINRCGSVLNIEVDIDNREKVILYQGSINECIGFIRGLEKLCNILGMRNIYVKTETN